MADAKIDTKGTHFPKLDVLNEIFSLAGNTHRASRNWSAGQFSHFAQFATPIAALAKAYADRKRATNAMDFDDLAGPLAQAAAGPCRSCGNITSAGSNSSSSMNTRTPTSCKAI